MGKPKISVLKENQKAIHPRSRKAKQISKKISRELKLIKRRGESNMKLQFLGDKLIWFKENMDQQLEVYAPKDVVELIQRYINRNVDEQEQIEMKNKIGDRLSRQHASREDHIRITREREMDQFTGSGFETVDLLNPKHLEVFKSWKGELRLLPNLKLRKFIKQKLEDGNTVDSSVPEKMEEDEDEISGEESEDDEEITNNAT